MGQIVYFAKLYELKGEGISEYVDDLGFITNFDEDEEVDPYAPYYDFCEHCGHEEESSSLLEAIYEAYNNNRFIEDTDLKNFEKNNPKIFLTENVEIKDGEVCVYAKPVDICVDISIYVIQDASLLQNHVILSPSDFHDMDAFNKKFSNIGIIAGIYPDSENETLYLVNEQFIFGRIDGKTIPIDVIRYDMIQYDNGLKKFFISSITDVINEGEELLNKFVYYVVEDDYKTHFVTIQGINKIDSEEEFTQFIMDHFDGNYALTIPFNDCPVKMIKDIECKIVRITKKG